MFFDRYWLRAIVAKLDYCTSLLNLLNERVVMRLGALEDRLDALERKEGDNGETQDKDRG